MRKRPSPLRDEDASRRKFSHIDKTSALGQSCMGNSNMLQQLMIEIANGFAKRMIGIIVSVSTIDKLLLLHVKLSLL